MHIKVLAINNDLQANRQLVSFFQKYLQSLLNHKLTFQFVVIEEDNLADLTAKGINRLPTCIVNDRPICGMTQIAKYFTTVLTKKKQSEEEPDEMVNNYLTDEVMQNNDDDEDEDESNKRDKDIRRRTAEQTAARTKSQNKHSRVQQQKPQPKRKSKKSNNNDAQYTARDHSGLNIGNSTNEDDKLVASMFESSE